MGVVPKQKCSFCLRSEMEPNSAFLTGPQVMPVLLVHKQARWGGSLAHAEWELYKNVYYRINYSSKKLELHMRNKDFNMLNINML